MRFDPWEGIGWGGAMGQLAGRIAVVSGGSRGIGRGIAEAFLAEGATVVITGKTKEKVHDVIDQAVAELGGVDILVNNAGGSSGFAMLGDLSDEAWEEAADWILNSAFWATRRALASMQAKGWGRIVNISSVEGKV